jgi:hypothetical protein
MRIITVVALFAVMLAGTAFAGDNGNGCKLIGTWIGETPYPLLDNPDFVLKFWLTYIGTGDNEGTEIVEWINFPHAPEVVYIGPRGVWQKSGPNKYDYTMLSFSSDLTTGQILFPVQRTSGTKTLTGCNTMEATLVYEFLDPVTMEPIGPPIAAGMATATRV